jgi:hypothetical protein
MTTEYTESRLSDDERREFLKVLGVAGAAATGGTALEEVTLSDLREAVTVESTGEFASRGEAIRNGLTGELNAELLGAEMTGVADAIDRLPEVRAAGFPDRGETLYAELTSSGWAIDEHLSEVGFYASTEANLPRFGSEHVEAMAKQLVGIESVEVALSEVGFDAHERTDVVANVVRQSEHLAMWQPTWGYEEVEGGDEFEVEPEYVSPLHERAAAGALLWIDGLDKHLRQKRVLITDQMLDDGIADVRAMLGGFYLLSDAADRLARGDISDAELTALVSGSTAMMIASQTDLQYDLVRITDEMRAPRTEGD